MKPRILLAALLVLIPGTTAQSADSAYSIAGTVVDAVTGNPIPRAELTLQIKGDEAAFTADSSGRFLFDHLEAGKYQLYGRASGYSSQGLNQHGSFFTSVVVGSGRDSEHIVFRLHPQAVVYGRVTDERGEAVRNAFVQIFSQSKDALRRSRASLSRTNDLGEYRFAGLLPGKYLVAVSAQPWYARTAFRYVPEQPDNKILSLGEFGPARNVQFDPALDVVYPLTFYSGVTDERSATELNLAEGETQQADIALRAVPAVHLRLTNLPPNQAEPSRIRGFQRIFGAISAGVPMQVAQISPGEVEIAGLPPGDIFFSLDPPDGDRRRAQQLEVNVSGEATVDASKTLPAAAVSGRIVTQDSGAIPEAGFVRLTGNSRDASAPIKKDGTFSLPSVPLGSYEVFVNLAGAPKYIRKISASGANTSGRRLVITSPGEVQLTIVASPGVGEIIGTAVRNGRPVAGVLVLLLSESGEDIDSDQRMDQSDSDGSFVLAILTPTKYRLLAIQDGWDLDYRDPAVIKPYLPKAQFVQIDPNDIKKLTVEVQPLLK